MKKVVFLLFAVALTVSCSQDITKNDPSFQGWKDDVLWRARDSYGELAPNNSLTITGLTTYETLVIQLPSINPGTYVIGNSELRKATFSNSREGQEQLFTTGNGIGDGQVVIESYDDERHTITGNFRFNLKNTSTDPAAPETMNFQNGVFYNVQVVPTIEP